jgi:hypothetical protein
VVLNMVQRLLGLLILSSISLLIISITFRGTLINVVSGQAVPLIPLTGGNATLNSGIPKFYNCIEREVKASKNVNDDPYFKSEPTKAEVFKCYNMIFKGSEQKSVS